MQRTPPAARELPRKGNLLPDVWLADAAGESRPLSAYRGAHTAVVVAAGSESDPLIRDLTALSNDFRAEGVAVLVIVPGAATPNSAHLIALADPDDSAHVRLAAAPRDSRHAWAAYVTDQYGEIYALFQEAAADAWPGARDLLEWAKFVNIRCEECFPPEWPDPQ